MTFTQEQVERIVLEVIRRLGLLDTNPTRQRGSEKTVDLTLADDVITTRTLEGRLDGVRRVLVEQRAVITPLVRDELKQRNIELVRQTN
jgi:hypothetical protein